MPLLAAIAIASLWQVAAHFLPWQLAIGKHISAHPTIAYIIGTIGMLIAFAAWELLTNLQSATYPASVALLAIAIASGAATLASHLADYILALRASDDARNAISNLH